MNHEKICVGRRVHFAAGYGNIDGDGLIVAVHGEPNPAPPQSFLGGVCRVVRPNDCAVDVILFDGRKLSGILQCGIDAPGIGIKLLDRVHGPELIEVAKRNAAQRAVDEKLAAEAAAHAFQKSEAGRVITDPPAFYWNGIKDAKGEKLQKCHYAMTGDVITIYARDYSRFSTKVRACFVVENDTDTMVDYFDNDRARVIPQHPLYPKVKAALEASRAHYAKRRSAA